MGGWVLRYCGQGVAIRWLTNRYLRVFLALLGLAYIAFSLLRDGPPLDDLATLPLGRSAVAAGTIVVAVIASAVAWSIVVEGSFATSGRMVLESLPAKYIPGGLGLPLSQLNFETRGGSPVGRTLARMFQHFFISVGAGGAGFLLMSVAQRPQLTWEIPVAVILAGVALLAHPVLIRRLQSFRSFAEASFAPMGRVMAAFTVTLVALVLMGFGYQTILNGMTGEQHDAAAAFVLAWSIGFAVVPIPAGLGLRESVLVAVLAPIPASIVVVAAVFFRLVAIAAEVVVSALAHLTPHRRAQDRSGTRSR